MRRSLLFDNQYHEPAAYVPYGRAIKIALCEVVAMVPRYSERSDENSFRPGS